MTVTDNGTQFAGTVPLGKLTTVVSTDNSGIYVLSPGKANDTLYIAGGSSTSVVKIPDPFIKSGFLP